MKKTTAVIAVLLSTAFTAPAYANDDVIRLGIGIAGALLGEAMKGGNNKASGRRNKGDVLEGRVGEVPSRNKGSRNRNKVAPAVAAGGAAAVAYALPEGDKAPIPEAKPTADQMAEYAALQPPLLSTPDVSDEFDESIPLTDERGRYWGAVAPADAEKVEAAVKLGMKPSVVIPEVTGLKLPEQEPLPTVEVQTAEAAPEKKQEVVPAMPSVAVVQETIESKGVPVAVDTTATTASVEKEPIVDLKPVEVKKPKAKVDL
jgi:hypothetical protein